MSRPFTYRPPNPFAKRAGILLLVLAALATLLGGMTIITASNLHVLYERPELAEQFDAIKKQYGVTDLKPFIIVYGVLILTYAAASFVLGLFVRGGHFVVLIVALVLTSLFTVFIGLIAIAALSMGSPLPLFAAAAHGLLVFWLVQAIRQAVTPIAAIPAYQPMRDYYTPLLPPTAAI
ncbi:MAG: hypothetical protein QM754_14725 [Tepidisphaeraceae bacterium]